MSELRFRRERTVTVKVFESTHLSTVFVRLGNVPASPAVSSNHIKTVKNLNFRLDFEYVLIDDISI